MLVAAQNFNNTNYYRNMIKVKNVAFKGSEEASTTIKNKVTEPYYENPINKKGEYALAIRDAFKDAAKVSFRAFAEIARCGIGSSDGDLGEFLAVSGLIGCGIGIVTFGFMLPKKLYEANINYFNKNKEMDVYTRANSAEVKIYEEMNEKMKDPEYQKEKLAEFYMKMQMVKNRPPSFIAQA